MANTTMSPNMNLVIPTVSTDPGPDWANNLNSSLSIIDQHNHSPGSGVPVTQDGISLSASGAPFDSLSFAGTNAYALRSVRFTAQPSALALATDLGCIYESGVDLYYNDGSGNQIRLTQGGSIVGTSGSISGLPSGTASASYSGGTFVWQSATLTAANMDAGSYILRNATASSKGLTLQPPNAMAADYSLTLPSLPGSTLIMRLDTSGNMSASLGVDNSTIEISSNSLQVKAGGITQTQLAANSVGTSQLIDGSVTVAKQASLNILSSSGSGAFTTSSTSNQDVTNLSISFTASGLRPIMMMLVGDGTSTGSQVSCSSADVAHFTFFRDGSVINDVFLTGTKENLPSIQQIDLPTAGVHVYKMGIHVSNTGSVSVTRCALQVYEL